MNHRLIHLLGVPKGSKVYIAGPMRGYHCFNFEQFFYWAAILRASGYIPINPAEMDCLRMFDGWVYSDDKYEEIMAIDLKAIREDADAIFSLAKWYDSPGALRENKEAGLKDIPDFYEVNFK